MHNNRVSHIISFYYLSNKESLSSVKSFIGNFIKDQILSSSRWVTFEGEIWAMCCETSHSPKFAEKLSGCWENGVQMQAGFANWSLAYGV